MDDLEMRRVSERLVEDVLNAEATKRFVSLLVRGKVATTRPTVSVSSNSYLKRYSSAGCTTTWQAATSFGQLLVRIANGSQHSVSQEPTRLSVLIASSSPF